MSINSIPVLLGSLSALMIGLFVFTRNPKSPINLAYGLFCLSLFGWLFGYSIVYSAKESVAAMAGTRIACAFAAFTAPSFYHFVISYLKKKEEERFVYLSYLVTLVFSILFVFTNYLLASPYKYSWGYYSHASTFHPIYLAVFFGIFIRGLFLLYIGYLNRKKLTPIEATRTVYVFTAYLVALLGAVDYIQKYGIDIYPFGWLFEVGFAIITAYAITKHRLLDIEVVIKKTVAYSILTALLTTLFVGLILLAQQIFRGMLGFTSIWVGLIAAFLIALIFQPLRDAIQGVVDRTFFKARYEYRNILSKYSHVLTHPMADLNRFSKLAPYLLWKSMKLSGASFMVLDRLTHEYVVRAGDGNCSDMIGQTVPENSALIQELILHAKVIDRNEVNRPEITTEMDRLKSVLIIPSISESEYFNKPTLLAAINLGKKLSDENYSKEDVDFLKTLANQATISIEYAFILEELKNNQEQIIKSEKLAALGTTTAGIAHELKNPLTYLLTVAQSMGTSWDNPNFKDSVIKMFPGEVERMKLIIDGLSDYSKQHELRIEPVEMTGIIEKVLAILAYEIKKNNVAVKKTYPPEDEKAIALADKYRIVQVFMNIIANAVQAMGKKGGNLSITLRSEEKEIYILITDTGPGIPAEQLQKIFDPFFTTKESGTGLGLSITKKIIDEHKGSVSVNSRVGKGTVFTVCLPRA